MEKLLKWIFVLVFAICFMACGKTKLPHELTYVQSEHKQLSINNQLTECLLIYTDYTNNTDTVAVPSEDAEIKAYQHDYPLSLVLSTDEMKEEYVASDTSVQAGSKEKVVWIFALEDESPVTFIFPDGSQHEVGW